MNCWPRRNSERSARGQEQQDAVGCGRLAPEASPRTPDSLRMFREQPPARARGRFQRFDLEPVSVHVPTLGPVHTRKPMLRRLYGAVSIASMVHLDDALRRLVRVACVITDAFGEPNSVVRHRLRSRITSLPKTSDYRNPDTEPLSKRKVSMSARKFARLYLAGTHATAFGSTKKGPLFRTGGQQPAWNMRRLGAAGARRAADGKFRPAGRCIGGAAPAPASKPCAVLRLTGAFVPRQDSLRGRPGDRPKHHPIA